MRGRKPKPTALKILEGARPSTINLNEPSFADDADPKPVDFLDGFAKEEWDRVYPELERNGVLKMVDRMVLVGYCEAYSEYRKSSIHLANSGNQIFTTPNGALQQVPYVSMKRNWLTIMLKFAVELGITPSARSRISALNDDDGEDEDTKFLFGDPGKQGAKK